jgi:hypothetical protein
MTASLTNLYDVKMWVTLKGGDVKLDLYNVKIK